ncbi:MAG: peptidase S8 [Chitinophagaceae bacterium]|nr:MAG: peptidase S8 [Chitinophagaceae bacterium]
MRKSLTLTICLLLVTYIGQAQLNRYIVEFKDKAGNPFSLGNPSAYLSQRAVSRRVQYNIAIDSTDLPITPRYMDSVRGAGAVTILNSSKWLNQVAIQTTDAAAIARINGFPFVKASTAVAARVPDAVESPDNKFEEMVAIDGAVEFPAPELSNIYNYGQSYPQVHIHQGEFLHNHGFSGQGMQLAMLDAGFPNYSALPTFDSVRINNQFLGTWDFVLNTANVNGFNSHGTQCLSTIGANNPGSFVGTAPKTSFYLFRTEDALTEYPIEEQNLVAALERADSLGVNIASLSLGYFTFDNTSFNHTYADMNGNTTMAARGADWAARKGMLLVIANGNEGGSSWHYLITPADADSVLSVGAVSSAGLVGGFSSYGPSSDGQVKPSVAAVGVNAIVAHPTTGVPFMSSGTSFACPNMAGLSTCLWQAFPESNNMGIISALQESASQYATPDDRKGHGIPDMKKAFVVLLKRNYSQQIQQAGCNTLLKWTAKSSDNMNFVVERKLPALREFCAGHF